MIIKNTISTISLIFSLLLSELIVRYLCKTPEVHRLNFESANSSFKPSDNPILGYEMKSSYKPGNTGKDYVFNTNSWGQRDKERSLSTPSNKKRLLMLGDSVVMGLCISNENLITEKLERQLGPNYEVLNFGVTGYAPPAEIELLKTKGLDFNPELVIWVLTSNDLELSNKNIAFLPQESQIYKWLIANSKLFLLTASYFDSLGLNPNLDGNTFITENVKATQNKKISYSFAQMKELSKKNNFSVLVLTWPTFEQNGIYYDDILNVHDENTNIYQKMSKKFGFDYLDLNKSFNHDWSKRESDHSSYNPRTYYTCDSMHASSNGAQATAEILSDWIKSNLSLISVIPS